MIKIYNRNNIGSPGNRTQNLSVKSRVLYHWVSDPFKQVKVYIQNNSIKSYIWFLKECIKWWKIILKKAVLFMNLNVISQLLTTFIIVSIGPAVIAYLAYKKAL